MTSQDSSNPLGLQTPVAAIDRDKYRSPPPPSSMTPPPSSQLAQMPPSVGPKSPTPAQSTQSAQSQLSSPPPTFFTFRKDGNVREPALQFFSEDQLVNADVEELRKMLNEISIQASESKKNAAHHTLQYRLLAMESSEAMNRMEVELQMSMKEVEVLQAQRTQQGKQGENNDPALATPVMSDKRLPSASMSPADHQLTALRDKCKLLEIENGELGDRYNDLKALMLEREKEAKEEITALRDRIRDNRKNFNRLRNANPDGSPFSAVTTPRAPNSREPRGGHFATPMTGRTPGTGGSRANNAAGSEPFAALLLADQVLNSQETATTPSTPTPHSRARKTPNTSNAHHRGSQSLSSLPTTPLQARSVPASARAGYPGPQPFATPRQNQAVPRTPPMPMTAPQPKGQSRGTTQHYAQHGRAPVIKQQSRRRSRDSTISVSEDEGPEAPAVLGNPYVLDDSEEDNQNKNTNQSAQHFARDEPITESQASQEARSMLRKSASRSFQSPQQPSYPKTPGSSGGRAAAPQTYAAIQPPPTPSPAPRRKSQTQTKEDRAATAAGKRGAAAFRASIASGKSQTSPTSAAFPMGGAMTATAGSGSGSGAKGGTSLVQSKIYGRVTKPGLSSGPATIDKGLKRKASGEYGAWNDEREVSPSPVRGSETTRATDVSPAKKTKWGDGVGLGITGS
ncbi:MAG: hypothetical protein M1831_000846 [Alyxoria varia]|nr:MAG: hypothetical protein M1831_000846 [Alyxoria varia]